MQTGLSDAGCRDHDKASSFSAASEPAWTAHAVSASALQTKTIAPLRYVVPGLVPEGATLLVSRPKLGTSWLMLDLCIAIAAGRTTLGDVQPATGDVLYLALGDGERRLQRRMATLLPEADAWPARLTLATQWKRANDGGLADIAAWCRSVRKPAAVVVDTLDRFRSMRGHGANQSCDAIVQLQTIANEYAIAVIIVHHERRTGADDPFDTISGPAGVGASADTVMIIKREERGTVLYIRGRDIEESQTLMVFDKARCKWSVAGPAAKSNERASILAALSHTAEPMSVRSLMAATGSTRAAVDSLLHRMVADGEIERIAQGRYALRFGGANGPAITFTWLPPQG